MTDVDMEPYLTMAADLEVTRYVSPTPILRASRLRNFATKPSSNQGLRRP